MKKYLSKIALFTLSLVLLALKGFSQSTTITANTVNVKVALYVGGLSSSGPNDSILTIDPVTHLAHWRTGVTNFYVANGLKPSTLITDTFYLGGNLNQNTSINLSGYSMSWIGLPNKSSFLSTDSVNITDITGKQWKVAASAIGGGGGSSIVMGLFNNYGPQLKGGSILNDSLYLSAADTLHPGGVSYTGLQIFGGEYQFGTATTVDTVFFTNIAPLQVGVGNIGLPSAPFLYAFVRNFSSEGAPMFFKSGTANPFGIMQTDGSWTFANGLVSNPDSIALRVWVRGNFKADSLLISPYTYSTPVRAGDTTDYKQVVVGVDGRYHIMPYWIGGSGGGTNYNIYPTNGLYPLNDSTFGWGKGSVNQNDTLSFSNANAMVWDSLAAGWYMQGLGNADIASGDSTLKITSNGQVLKSPLYGIVGSANLTAQTSANASIASFTVGSTTGTFEVGGYVDITAATTDALTCEVVWTDENSTARTYVWGIAGPTLGFSPWQTITIRAKNATTITIKTVQQTGGGSETYDVGALIKHLQ